MALQGTIDTFELTEVVRLLAAGSKTGELRLEGTRGSGRLWVDGGKVTAIQVDHAPRAEGLAEAMFELLRFEDGSFTFVSGEQPGDAGEPTDLEEILGEAEAQLAEWREIEAVVPTTRATVTLRPDLSRADVVLDRQRWRQVATIGGGITVATLGEVLGLGELPVSRAVKDLVELGVVDLDATPADEPEPVVVDPAAEEPPLVAEETEPVDFELPDADEDQPFVIETEPVAVDGDANSARAQLDEFAAGFGLSDEPAHEAPAADDQPLDVAPHVEDGGFGDFGVDVTPPADGNGFDEAAFSGLQGSDPLGDFALGFEGEPAGLSADLAPPTPVVDPLGDPSPFLSAGNDAAEVARQLSNLSPAAARAVAAAARATTDEEREAALAAVAQEGEEPIDRELLLRFLASVKS